MSVATDAVVTEVLSDSPVVDAGVTSRLPNPAAVEQRGPRGFGFPTATGTARGFSFSFSLDFEVTEPDARVDVAINVPDMDRTFVGLVLSGVNVVRFADLAPPDDAPLVLTSLQFNVYSVHAGPSDFTLCVSNLRVF